MANIDYTSAVIVDTNTINKVNNNETFIRETPYINRTVRPTPQAGKVVGIKGGTIYFWDVDGLQSLVVQDSNQISFKWVEPDGTIDNVINNTFDTSQYYSDVDNKVLSPVVADNDATLFKIYVNLTTGGYIASRGFVNYSSISTAKNRADTEYVPLFNGYMLIGAFVARKDSVNFTTTRFHLIDVSKFGELGTQTNEIEPPINLSISLTNTTEWNTFFTDTNTNPIVHTQNLGFENFNNNGVYRNTTIKRFTAFSCNITTKLSYSGMDNNILRIKFAGDPTLFTLVQTKDEHTASSSRSLTVNGILQYTGAIEENNTLIQFSLSPAQQATDIEYIEFAGTKLLIYSQLEHQYIDNITFTGVELW